MRKTALLALGVLFPVFSGCMADVGTPQETAPPSPLAPLPDPAILGNLTFDRFEFDFGVMVAGDSEIAAYNYPVQVTGSVHVPKAATAPSPLLVFMHGRHGTCAVGGAEIIFTHVCPDGPPVIEPVTSYTGYDYLAENLASHGYVVASINANQINDRDLAGDSGALARAQLTVRTIEEFTRLNQEGGTSPLGVAVKGAIDLSRIGLMGHSRGGEGVTKAITYNQALAKPHAIKAVFALAPTDFARHLAPNVAFATLLPYCDGDVSSLHGAAIYDDARYLQESNPSPKIQFLALGANHNFYNTVWTYDDAGGTDKYCGRDGEGRYSPEDQRRHGLVLMSSFFRAYVGGETDFLLLMTGEAPMPASACPGGDAMCDDEIHVSYHAPATHRLLLEDGTGAPSSIPDLGDARREGDLKVTACKWQQCPTQPNYSRADQFTFDWEASSAFVLEIPEANRDVSRFDVFSFRAGVNFDSEKNPSNRPVDVTIEIMDVKGGHAAVQSENVTHALYYPPSESRARVVLNTVRIPLALFEGVDLTQVKEITLRFEKTGQIQVADFLLQATHA